MGQWDWIEDQDVNPHTYEHPIFTKKPKLCSGKKKAPSTNGTSITGCLHVEEEYK